MREIKFRAWDKEKKEWALKEFGLIGEVTTFDLIRQYQIKDLNNLVISQHTGLKDKNGVEIYEGDIVRFLDRYTKKAGGPFVELEKTGQVLFEDGAYLIKSNGFYGDLSMKKKSVYKLEVIGNIYQNPESLETK